MHDFWNWYLIQLPLTEVHNVCAISCCILAVLGIKIGCTCVTRSWDELPHKTVLQSCSSLWKRSFRRNFHYSANLQLLIHVLWHSNSMSRCYWHKLISKFCEEVTLNISIQIDSIAVLNGFTWILWLTNVFQQNHPNLLNYERRF